MEHTEPMLPITLLTLLTLLAPSPFVLVRVRLELLPLTLLHEFLRPWPLAARAIWLVEEQ
jgi:hypothetical protein